MILSNVILGMLAVAPMTGYDLKKRFDTTVAHFWSADKAQIYRTLARLVADDLAVVMTVRQDGLPDRQEHHITDTGRTALAEWLLSAPDPYRERDPFLARVFFSGTLEPDDILALLWARRLAAQSMLDELVSQLGPSVTPVSKNREEYMRSATLRNGISHVRAELEWLEAVEEGLQ
ncbi:PadR family transcriptional regulator [Arthrobacter sp. H20]|uniref:PadR family transcriptional regulator n=1 Tax=Arthrobacter sp. H20 TaxID=1267981 RepID=UPI00047B9788|nr:PadR family transcriptional regulator [Arthrobacter sp. H20]